MKALKYLLWYCRSDIEVQVKEEWCPLKNEKMIEGFYFYNKKPFSKLYKRQGSLELIYLYPIIKLIEKGQKENIKSVKMNVSIWYRCALEQVEIHKCNYKKAENQMYDMAKKIQSQY